jgi:hypothetical protein
MGRAGNKKPRTEVRGERAVTGFQRIAAGGSSCPPVVVSASRYFAAGVGVGVVVVLPAFL